MINILIVDDHAMMRVGLDQLLSSDRNMFVVGHACDGLESIELSESLQPDVVLMDVAMPKMDGLTAAQMIHQQNPHIKIIILSAYNDEIVSRVALLVGVRQILSKSASVNEILETVRTVSRGW